MIVNNTPRNYEYLTSYLEVLIAQYVTGFGLNIYSEMYDDIDLSKTPYINIILNSINHVRRTQIDSSNECRVEIIVVSDEIHKGVKNSSKSKRRTLAILGRIENLLNKVLAYELSYSNKIIGEVTVESIGFSSKSVYNASGVVAGAIDVRFLIHEDNENAFVDRLEQIYTELGVGNDDEIKYILDNKIME